MPSYAHEFSWISEGFYDSQPTHKEMQVTLVSPSLILLKGGSQIKEGFIHSSTSLGSISYLHG